MLPFVSRRRYPEDQKDLEDQSSIRGYVSPSPNGHGHKCSSVFTQGQVITYAFPTLKGPDDWDVPISTKTYAAPAPSGVWGDGVVVMWQKSDESVLVEAAQQTSASQTESDSSGVTSTSTTSPSISPAAPGGLSTGAKAEIGVGRR